MNRSDKKRRNSHSTTAEVSVVVQHTHTHIRNILLLVCPYPFYMETDMSISRIQHSNYTQIFLWAFLLGLATKSTNTKIMETIIAIILAMVMEHSFLCLFGKNIQICYSIWEWGTNHIFSPMSGFFVLECRKTHIHQNTEALSLALWH